MVVDPLQVIVIVFSLFALSRLVLRRKDRAIPLGELIFWAVIWLGAIFLAIFPSVFNSAANRTGVENTINLIIAVAIITIFYLQFRLYVRVEKQGQDITRLVREISLRGKK